MKHVVVAVMAASGIAHADELTATLGEPLFEASHTVEIRVADGVATYRVERRFTNPGKRADEASLSIDLPYGAAATGLRIRARDRWYDGDLMERDRAAALYHELTGFGAYQPKDPALLQWQWADKLHLQVFPVLPGQVSTVEYTLTVPTRYEGGRYWISYPRVAAGANASPTSRRLATPTVTVRPAWPTPSAPIVSGAAAPIVPSAGAPIVPGAAAPIVPGAAAPILPGASAPILPGASAPILIDGKPAASGASIALTPPAHQGWQDAVAADPAASYAASAIAIPASRHTTRPITTAVITLDIAHTFNSDLRIELVTPQGQTVTLADRQGGDANGVHGRFTLAMPPGTTGAGTWRLVASDHARLDTGAIDGWSIAFGEAADATTAAATDTPVFIPDAPETANDAGVAAIAIAPPPIAAWTARFGRVVASSQHAFARLEIDVAPQLTPLPRRAQIVFVIDASYSVGAAQLAAQLEVIRAYLAYVPDAQVELIAVRRHATRRFGAFVSARAALAAIAPLAGDAGHAELAAHGAFALGNGSAIDEGARLAAAALADRIGPRRVVVTTDELFRDALSPDRALAAFAALSPDTVVHVVVPTVDGDDRVTMTPADDDRFDALATHHHGIHVALRGVPAAGKALAPVVLELVRPTKIDHLTVTGVTSDATTLHEGAGLRVFEGVATAPERLAIAGTLWSDPIRLAVEPLPGFSRQTAAFVFGADEYHELSDGEMMAVAMMGGAVSPVTSYVAAEPGTRPSTIGLPERGGFGTLGAGRGGAAGYGTGGGALRRPPDLGALIDTAACEDHVKPAAGWRVALDVETTRDEIVDVIGGAAPDAMTACVVEAAWRVRLDPATFWEQRETYHVALGAAAH